MRFADQSRSNAKRGLPAAARTDSSGLCAKCPSSLATSTYQRAVRHTRRPDVLLRHHFAPPDIDAIGLQRAIRFLECPHDRNMCARLQLALISRHISENGSLRRHYDLLFAPLVPDCHYLPVDTGHRLIDGAVGHRAVWTRIPWPMALAQPALRLG